jgi:arginine/lysine/ornithine decarboxylase
MTFNETKLHTNMIEPDDLIDRNNNNSEFSQLIICDSRAIFQMSQQNHLRNIFLAQNQYV